MSPSPHATAARILCRAAELQSCSLRGKQDDRSEQPLDVCATAVGNIVETGGSSFRWEPASLLRADPRHWDEVGGDWFGSSGKKGETGTGRVADDGRISFGRLKPPFHFAPPLPLITQLLSRAHHLHRRPIAFGHQHHTHTLKHTRGVPSVPPNSQNRRTRSRLRGQVLPEAHNKHRTHFLNPKGPCIHRFGW